MAVCEVTAVIDPELIGRYFGKLTVELIINDAYWQDADDITWTSPTGNGAIATHSLTTFAGSSAPIEDAIFCIDGPITSPRLLDPATGHAVTFDGAVPAGKQWVLNARTFASTVGASQGFANTGTSVVTQTRAVGPYSPSMYTITAEASSPPRVKLAGSGVATTTRLRIRGRRKYA